MADVKTQPRALVSVYDKRSLVPFTAGLVELGFEILSSGGTSKELADHKIPHIQVSDLTGYAEALDGKVKTLHPVIHAGILANPNDPKHLSQLKDIGTSPIGLVICNLYPFQASPSTELIDIGGPAMVRAAAKNQEYTGVIIDPDDYEEVLAELKANSADLSSDTRRRLAQKAFAHTAQYDSAISSWLEPEGSSSQGQTSQPESLKLNLTKIQALRYGENPHQQGGLYINQNSQSFWANTEQLSGKEMSYLNVYDAAAGWLLVNDLEVAGLASKSPAAVVIKHGNPCGTAIAKDIADAYAKALACDPVSAFGGVIALNQPVTKDCANQIAQIFTEVLIAPDFQPQALDILKSKKNLRLLRAPAPTPPETAIRSVGNAFLIQTPDQELGQDFRVVTSLQPTESEWQDLRFGFRVVQATSSNAIVIAKDLAALGIGAGQQNRKDAGHLAAQKAGDRAKGGIYASDAFFPFPDGLDGAIQAGCRAVIQPGGSVRDEEVIAAAEAADLAMVFTGTRHFRH